MRMTPQIERKTRRISVHFVMRCEPSQWFQSERMKLGQAIEERIDNAHFGPARVRSRVERIRLIPVGVDKALPRRWRCRAEVSAVVCTRGQYHRPCGQHSATWNHDGLQLVSIQVSLNIRPWNGSPTTSPFTNGLHKKTDTSLYSGMHGMARSRNRSQSASLSMRSAGSRMALAATSNASYLGSLQPEPLAAVELIKRLRNNVGSSNA